MAGVPGGGGAADAERQRQWQQVWSGWGAEHEARGVERQMQWGGPAAQPAVAATRQPPHLHAHAPAPPLAAGQPHMPQRHRAGPSHQPHAAPPLLPFAVHPSHVPHLPQPTQPAAMPAPASMPHAPPAANVALPLSGIHAAANPPPGLPLPGLSSGLNNGLRAPGLSGCGLAAPAERLDPWAAKPAPAAAVQSWGGAQNGATTAGTWQPLPIASLGNGPLRDPWADPATAFAAAPRQPTAPAPLGIGGAATLTTALPLPGFGPSSVWR